MATTLDQSLMNLLVHVQEKNLNDILDRDKWTKESIQNQSLKMKEIVDSSADLALDLIKEMIETEHEGRPLLQWYLYSFSLTASLNVYQDFRSHYELMDDRDSSPFNSQWLSDKIIEITTELKRVDEILLKHDLLNQDEEL